MSEGEVKHVVRGRWRPATKEEREDDRDLYVPFVLQGVKLGGREFIGLFGFTRADGRLARVTLHSGIPWLGVAEGRAIFQRLAEQLERELGTPARIVTDNSGHTGFYVDYAMWRSPSSEILLTCISPSDTERAVVVSYAPPSEGNR
jgi:hypothetical protein